MNKKNLKYFQRTLSTQLQDLRSGQNCNLDDLKAWGEHLTDPLDQAAHATERHFSHQLCSRNNEIISEIEQALQNIEDGVYGICALCEEDIPIKRLKAKPMAQYCIRCKTKLENEQRFTDA